jgi:hypothetical protein
MAIAGIVLGALGSLFFLGSVGFMVYAFVSASSAASSPPAPGPPVPSPATATTTSTVPPGGWGRIHVVDLHASATPLRAQLAEEVHSASEAGEVVLVETTSRACAACSEIALAMREPALQTALATVRVVRVDVDELQAEVAPLHMKESRLPWFYLLDARGEPRDAISADEWGDNVADDIAPVLEAFDNGSLKKRRARWHGTPL